MFPTNGYYILHWWKSSHKDWLNFFAVSIMPWCLQQYLISFFCHITNFNAASSEMFWVNTFVTELLVLFHRGENSQNKQAAKEIHSFPSLKLSKHEIVWKQHTKFLSRARDDSKRYAVTKAFFVLKGRTDITWNITAITH